MSSIFGDIDSIEDYVKATARTWTGEFHGRLVNNYRLHQDIDEAISVLDVKLDDAKKALFYGQEETSRISSRSEVLSDAFDTGKRKDILHAALGIATEAGEILKAISVRFIRADIDEVNLAEELGDLMYYVARMADAIGVDLLDVMKTNIEKLESRFPEEFTQEDALNRDREKEREILESE